MEYIVGGSNVLCRKPILDWNRSETLHRYALDFLLLFLLNDLLATEINLFYIHTRIQTMNR